MEKKPKFQRVPIDEAKAEAKKGEKQRVQAQS
jgi:hypothetical protein